MVQNNLFSMYSEILSNGWQLEPELLEKIEPIEIIDADLDLFSEEVERAILEENGAAMTGKLEFFHYQQVRGSRDKAVLQKSRMSEHLVGNVLSIFFLYNMFLPMQFPVVKIIYCNSF